MSSRRNCDQVFTASFSTTLPSYPPHLQQDPWTPPTARMLCMTCFHHKIDPNYIGPMAHGLCSVPVFRPPALTYPIFHPPCYLTNAHLPHSHPFFDFNTCVIGPHISLYIIMSKVVHSLIAIVMKTQTSPPASSIADLLNGMSPLGNISYFLLVFLLRLVSP